jgi:hypothetical protein
MTNCVGYNQLPNEKEFTELYSVKSQQELAEYYGCNKARIRKWINIFGLKLRTKGGGNNRKYQINESQLRELVEKKYSNQDILKILNVDCNSSLNKWLKKYNIKREYSTNEYKKYCRKVRFFTEKEYSKYHDIINPSKLPRTLCGVDGGYQLDHIMGVSDCFYSGVSVEECSSLKNLQLISWKENLNKRKFHKNNKDNK